MLGVEGMTADDDAVGGLEGDAFVAVRVSRKVGFVGRKMSAFLTGTEGNGDDRDGVRGSELRTALAVFDP